MIRSAYQTLIDAIADDTPNTALELRTILTALADGAFQTGDVKEVDVSTSYIATNFDSTGLGINERVGWAICNGNNGTRDRHGKVAIGYGASGYSTLGATGGSENSVVVEHSHTTVPNTNLATGTGDGVSRSKAAIEPFGIGNTINVTVNNAGVSGVGKNMQPYIVTLFIQKL